MSELREKIAEIIDYNLIAPDDDKIKCTADAILSEVIADIERVENPYNRFAQFDQYVAYAEAIQVVIVRLEGPRA